MGGYMRSEKCPYFRIHERARKQSFETKVAVPYCAHPKHSPYGKGMVMRGVNGGHLECGGSLRKCPIAVVWQDADKPSN